MRRLLLVASLALASGRAPWARRTATTPASPAAPPSGAAFVASLKAGEEVVFGVGTTDGRPLHTCAWRNEFRYRVVVSAFANE